MTKLAPPIPTNAFIEAVLSHLDRLPYWERRIFIERRIPDQYPRFFYKYFGLDPANPKSVRNLRDVLVESRFWLADHERFNDPFDLKANVVFEGTTEQKERRLKALIANQNPAARRKERREVLAQMMARTDAEWDIALKDIFRTRAKEIGVCSFATDSKPPLGPRDATTSIAESAVTSGPRSILMWAHYGRNHEGVCLQFETTLSPRVFTYAQEVEYSEEYPRLDYINNFEASILVPLVRKHKGWEYEKEWRILHMNGVNSHLPFEPRALRRLIFGCRASPEVYACVVSLLEERSAKGHPPVKLFRAVQHATEYKLLLWSVRERS